jgi:hypothetical protein
MPFLVYSTKQAARRAARNWGLAGAKLQVLTAVFGNAPGMGASAAISEVLGDVSLYLALEANNAASDPPRRDYYRDTRAGHRPIRKLKDDLPAPASRFVTNAEDGRSFLAAFVRALERSQGAEQVNEREFAQRHVTEARRFAREFARVAPQLAESAFELEDFKPDAGAQIARSGVDTADLATAAWRRVGFPTRDVEILQSIWIKEFSVPIESRLERAAESTRSLGRELETAEFADELVYDEPPWDEND